MKLHELSQAADEVSVTCDGPSSSPLWRVVARWYDYQGATLRLSSEGETLRAALDQLEEAKDMSFLAVKA